MVAASGDNRSFLNIDKSISGKRWVDRLDASSRNTALAIAQEQDVPEILGRILAGRGVEKDTAPQYLAPTIRDMMPDPGILTDMNAAVARLVMAIEKHEKVAIFGDYDVDGACSSALVARYLTFLGVENEIYIPDRIFEGYGPNPDAIRTLVNNGARLIVTVDCGATSFEALEEASKLGVDVIVLDHHQMGAEMPQCAALVNPNRQDDLSGLGFLCAAGVVFMTLVATNRALRDAAPDAQLPDLLSWLDMVALATVCDVVPLEGINRAFVATGLRILSRFQNAGLKALMNTARLDGPPTPYHLGFVLGPRINAGGRIGDAALGARLLTCDDEYLAAEISEKLEQLNKERQRIESEMLQAALGEAEMEMRDGEGPSVLVTASEHWHPGVVGLLASRLKERFQRPAFAIAFDRHGKGSGSGRSINGVDLGAAVRAAVAGDILEKGGGHAMAAGLTIEKKQLGALRGFMEERLSDAVARERTRQNLKIDGALTSRSVNLQLYKLLEQAGPFGQGNPQPVFVLPAHTVRNVKIVGQDHVAFTASAGDGANLRCIAFRAADTELGRALTEQNTKPMHIAGTLSGDFWQGQQRLQLRVLDAAFAD